MTQISSFTKFKKKNNYPDHRFGSACLHRNDLWILIPKNASSTIKTIIHGKEVKNKISLVNFADDPLLLKKNVIAITREPIERFITGYLTCISRGPITKILKFKDNPFDNLVKFVDDLIINGPADEHVEKQSWFLPNKIDKFIKIENLKFKEQHNKNNHPLKHRLYNFLIESPELIYNLKNFYQKDFVLYNQSS